MKTILICADDYGMNPAIDRGVLQLVTLKRLSAFSCMTLSPYWPVAARNIRQDIRNIAFIGLHLDFTEFSQPAGMPLKTLILNTLLRRLSVTELEYVIHRQIDLFEDATGVLPDYLDGHQHVHQLPQIREAMIKVIAQRFLQKKPWIRIARTPGYQGLKAALISSLGATELTTLCRQAGLMHTNYLLGIYGFDGDAANYARRLNNWLALAAGQPADALVALMCHPAISSNRPEQPDPIREARNTESAVLSSDILPALLQRHGLILANASTMHLT